MRITAANIVAAINRLSKSVSFNYINASTKTLVKLERVILPEGPIYIKRYDPTKGQTLAQSAEETISVSMIWRVANAFVPDQPVNFDRVLGASYNTRSALETLLAHTAEFYYCYPGRIENIQSRSQVKKGHKHIIWCPSSPHELGVLVEKETEMVVSEVPNLDVVYDALVIPDDLIFEDMNEEIKRRHSQIQIALIKIGEQLGFRTWVAQNDRGILYDQRRIAEMPTVVDSLKEEPLIYPYPGAIRAAHLIDNIWFNGNFSIPAVMEVEHSTGVTSGLTRMKGLYDATPRLASTRYVIVAADEERELVVREANRPQFQSLNTQFFPYSAVEELYSLCTRRKIKGVTEEFLDCFMESVVE